MADALSARFGSEIGTKIGGAMAEEGTLSAIAKNAVGRAAAVNDLSILGDATRAEIATFIRQRFPGLSAQKAQSMAETIVPSVLLNNQANPTTVDMQALADARAAAEAQAAAQKEAKMATMDADVAPTPQALEEQKVRGMLAAAERQRTEIRHAPPSLLPLHRPVILGQAALAGFFVEVGQVVPGLHHDLHDLVERDPMDAVGER